MDASVNAVDETEELTVSTQGAKNKTNSRCVYKLYIPELYMFIIRLEARLQPNIGNTLQP